MNRAYEFFHSQAEDEDTGRFLAENLPFSGGPRTSHALDLGD